MAWASVRFGVESVDDAVQVAEDPCVHFGQPLLAAGFGGGNDLHDLGPVFAVLREEVGRGDEHGTGQAGVGVRAGFLDRETAVAVGKCLGGPAEALFGPGGLGEGPVGIKFDDAAGCVDFPCGFPVSPELCR